MLAKPVANCTNYYAIQFYKNHLNSFFGNIYSIIHYLYFLRNRLPVQ